MISPREPSRPPPVHPAPEGRSSRGEAPRAPAELATPDAAAPAAGRAEAPDAVAALRSLAVRFVDAHSGCNDLLGRVAALEALAAVVARRLEDARPGSRFPLLRLVGRREPLTATECDSLARETARLRQRLAAVPVGDLGAGPGAVADPSAADDDVGPEAAPARRRRDPTAPDDDPRPARTLADVYDDTLYVLEHIARLGAASRRGARFEVGDAEAFAASATPLRGPARRDGPPSGAGRPRLGPAGP